MVDSVRVIRGDHWGARLQQELVTPPADIVPWMKQHTHPLKSDALCEVGLLQLQQDLCYLKLYRHKSALQRLLFRLGQGRAVRSYDAARELASSGVPVPAPRACLLVPQGMLLLTQGIPDAGNLNALWLQQPTADQARPWLHRAGEVLALLHRSGYAHGDCKWSNLMWTGRQLYLVDLDAVSSTSAGGAKQARDLARFTLNAEELGVAPALYDVFLGSYLQGVGGQRQGVIDRMLPVLQILRARHQAKYGQRGQRLLP